MPSSATGCARTLRKLEVIGQAAKNLSEQTKSREPEIPWKQIAGMRDKVSHDYFGVNLEIVCGVVQKELPKPRAAIAPFWNNCELYLRAKLGPARILTLRAATLRPLSGVSASRISSAMPSQNQS